MHYTVLATQKFSSHVVEKCLRFYPESQTKIVRELFSVPHFENLLEDLQHRPFLAASPSFVFFAGPSSQPLELKKKQMRDKVREIERELVNLCLYGLPNETWEGNLPVNEDKKDDAASGFSLALLRERLT